MSKREEPQNDESYEEETSDTSAEGQASLVGTRAGTVALVGRPNVGKSTLLNAALGAKIAATTHKPQTTRRQLRGVLTREQAQLIFIDTPGLLARASGLDAYMLEEALDAVRDVDVVVFLAEAHVSKNRDGTTKVEVDRRDEEALATLERETKAKQPIYLVLNKIDRLPQRDLLLPFIGEWGAKKDFRAILPISAMKREGIDTFLDVISGALPESPFLFPEESLTDTSEREIAAELIREKAMLELADELPYKVAVQVEEFDETRRDDERKSLVQIAAVIHVERDSQKRIVVGKKGERVKTIGMRARKELERLLGCQVMLRIFVHVEPGWTQTDKGLRKVGYTSRKS